MKNPTSKMKRKISVAICCYIIASGNILFFLLIDRYIGIKETMGQFLMLAFFFLWTGLLFYIEQKFFKGLYEKWKNEDTY